MASFEEVAGGRVRASVCKAGQRDSKTLDSMKEAKVWAKIREGELLQGVKQEKARRGTQTVAQALERYMVEEAPRRKADAAEIGRCKAALKSLPFRDAKIGTITSEPIQDWADARERKVSPATVNRDLNFLSAVFTAALKWKWISHHPVQDVERPIDPDARMRRVAAWETDAMLEVLGYERGTVPVTESERLAVAFLFALEAGMRKGEILKTKRANVHEHHIFLPGEITKTGKWRNVAFTPEAKRLIELLPKDHELLFGGLTAARGDVLWRTARAKTKVVDLHFHDSRHEAVTRLAARMPLPALALQIGHTDLNSLKVYYNATPAEMAAMLE